MSLIKTIDESAHSCIRNSNADPFRPHLQKLFELDPKDISNSVFDRLALVSLMDQLKLISEIQSTMKVYQPINNSYSTFQSIHEKFGEEWLEIDILFRAQIVLTVLRDEIEADVVNIGAAMIDPYFNELAKLFNDIDENGESKRVHDKLNDVLDDILVDNEESFLTQKVKNLFKEFNFESLMEKVYRFCREVNRKLEKPEPMNQPKNQKLVVHEKDFANDDEPLDAFQRALKSGRKGGAGSLKPDGTRRFLTRSNSDDSSGEKVAWSDSDCPRSEHTAKSETKNKAKSKIEQTLTPINKNKKRKRHSKESESLGFERKRKRNAKGLRKSNSLEKISKHIKLTNTI